MRKLIFTSIAATILLSGCQESLEKRALREAREYTERYCPTPVQNYTRTDSVVFDLASHTYHYYCSVVGDLDDAKIFGLNQKKIDGALLQSVRENTSFLAYKKEGFSFAWTLRSGKNPKVVYFNRKYTTKDYK